MQGARNPAATSASDGLSFVSQGQGDLNERTPRSKRLSCGPYVGTGGDEVFLPARVGTPGAVDWGHSPRTSPPAPGLLRGLARSALTPALESRGWPGGPLVFLSF